MNVQRELAAVVVFLLLGAAGCSADVAAADPVALQAEALSSSCAPDADAALALEARHQGPIDVVCTDVVMPGRQARDLLTELQTRRPQAGILVCSGYSEDEQIHRGIHSGEFSHLSKPFTRGQLLAAVRAALQGRSNSVHA